MKVKALKHFGSHKPGDIVEVSEGRAAYLRVHKAVEIVSTPEKDGTSSDVTRQVHALTDEETRVPPGTVSEPDDKFVEFLRGQVSELALNSLVNAGLDNKQAIENASDEELDELEGVGPSTVERLRKVVGDYTKPE